VIRRLDSDLSPPPATNRKNWASSLRRISTEFLSLADREDRLDVETQMRNLSLDYFELAQADDAKGILADRSHHESQLRNLCGR
jgi:hypothetical protein